MLRKNSSFSSTSQDTGFFDIVIGNPPYGAKLSSQEKKYFRDHYKSVKTIKGVQKGSLDSFSIFIENGYNLLRLNGQLNFIVSMAFASSDSMIGLHKLLFSNCKQIKVSSYAKRPRQIFRNACIATSILSLIKTNTQCEVLLTSKLNRWKKGIALQELIDELAFTNSIDFCLPGRLPKIGLEIEKSILKKLFLCDNFPINNLLRKKGKPVYYRTSGGRYFNVITNYSTGSTKEKAIIFENSLRNSIGAILSSNLFYWYQQVYSNTLDLKSYEITSFPIPVKRLTIEKINFIEVLYKKYLQDIEKNAMSHTTENYVHIDSYKEYIIRKSKQLIDEIDDLICPLYGLTSEEIEFIKNYEKEFRITDKD